MGDFFLTVPTDSKLARMTGMEIERKFGVKLTYMRQEDENTIIHIKGKMEKVMRLRRIAEADKKTKTLRKR